MTLQEKLKPLGIDFNSMTYLEKLSFLLPLEGKMHPLSSMVLTELKTKRDSSEPFAPEDKEWMDDMFGAIEILRKRGEND